MTKTSFFFFKKKQCPSIKGSKVLHFPITLPLHIIPILEGSVTWCCHAQHFDEKVGGFSKKHLNDIVLCSTLGIEGAP